MSLALAIVALTAFVMPSCAAGFQIEAIPPKVLPGEAFVVRVSGTFTGDAPEVKVAGLREPVPLVFCGQGCLEGIAGVAMKTAPGRLGITARYQDEEVAAGLLVGRTSFPVERLTVDRKKVVLSRRDERRANAEELRMKEIYKERSNIAHWGGIGFIMPVEDRVTLKFGTRRIFNNKKVSIHRGMDIRGMVGTPVHAMSRGRVVLAGDLFFGGGTVIIDHGQGVFSTYMHLSGILAVEGEYVEQSQAVGLVGATGRVTGPHLHLAVKVRGVDVSPASLAGLSVSAAESGR